MRKKSTISWFVFTCVLCLGFSKTTASLTRMLGLSVYAYFALTAALIGAVLLLFYLPIKLLAGKFNWKAGCRITGSNRGSAAGIFEPTAKISPADWIALLLLLGALACVRIFLAPAGSGWIGNVMLANLAAQVIGSFFLYIGVRMLSGPVCAVAALVFVIALPVYHNSVYMAEPQSLLLLEYGLLLWICACCLGRIGSAAGKGSVYIPALTAGFLCGAAAFINTHLCGLLFLAGAGLGRLPKKFRKPAVISFYCAVLAGFFLWFGCSVYFFGRGQTCPEKCLNIFGEWLTSGSTREYDLLLHSPTLMDYWMTVPPYLLAFLAIFGASDTDRGNGRPWIWPLVLTVILETLGNAPLQEQGIRFVLLGVMAGYGVRRMFLGESRECFAEAGEDTWQEDLEEKVEKMMDAEKTETEQKNAAQKKPGEYLDNPLPVPKRHVKKEMNYGFEPDEDQMFYDIPVSDQDDFDI